MTVYEDLYRTNVPTESEDTNDVFRFGQLRETTQDCFSTELRNFFSKESDKFSDRLSAVPTIRKYSLDYEANESSPESFMTLIQNHPDILENLPAVAIGIASGNQKKLGFNSQFVDVVQPPPRLVGSVDLTNPVAINDGDILAWETTPDGVNPTTSLIQINSTLVTNINSVPLREIVNAINIQSLYVVASIEKVNGQNRLRLTPGKLGVNSPNKIEILSDSTSSLLATLGFNVGDSDDTNNPNRPPCNRYQLSADQTVVLDVLSEDVNQTREVSDLIQYFFSLEMDSRDFTFYGRSIFDESVVGESFQIILKDNLSTSTYEVPRAGTDQLNLIFGNRINIPLTIIDYIDKKVIDPDSFIRPENYEPEPIDAPLGDYTDLSEVIR